MLKHFIEYILILFYNFRYDAIHGNDLKSETIGNDKIYVYAELHELCRYIIMNSS